MRLFRRFDDNDAGLLRLTTDVDLLHSSFTAYGMKTLSEFFEKSYKKWYVADRQIQFNLSLGDQA